MSDKSAKIIEVVGPKGHRSPELLRLLQMARKIGLAAVLFYLRIRPGLTFCSIFMSFTKGQLRKKHLVTLDSKQFFKS